MDLMLHVTETGDDGPGSKMVLTVLFSNNV